MWTKKKLLEQVKRRKDDVYYNIAFCADNTVYQEASLTNVQDGLAKNKQVQIRWGCENVKCEILAVRFNGHDLVFQLLVTDNISETSKIAIETQGWYPYQILSDISTGFVFIPIQSNAIKIMSYKQD